MKLSSSGRKERKICSHMDYFQREGFSLSGIDRAKSALAYAEACRLMDQLIEMQGIRQPN